MDRRHLERAVISIPGLILSGFTSRDCVCYRKNRGILLDKPEYLMEFIALVKAIEKSKIRKEAIGSKRSKNRIGLQGIKTKIESELNRRIHDGLLVAAFNHCGYEIKETDEVTNPLIGIDPTTKTSGFKVTK